MDLAPGRFTNVHMLSFWGHCQHAQYLSEILLRMAAPMVLHCICPPRAQVMFLYNAVDDLAPLVGSVENLHPPWGTALSLGGSFRHGVRRVHIHLMLGWCASVPSCTQQNKFFCGTYDQGISWHTA
jgi:hypothetical protein